MSNDMVNMSKAGGDANINSAGVGSGAGTGGAHGHADSMAFGRGADSDATGLGASGSAFSGGNAVGSAGGDITDNTDIGAINISS